MTTPDGSVVGAGAPEQVPFTLKILGKNSLDNTVCELYREDRLVTVKDGNFTIPVGNGDGATVSAPAGMTFARIFGSANLTGQESCLFEPTKAGAYRGLDIGIERDGDRIDLGEVVLAESPRATVAGTAETLGEFQNSNFFRVVDGGVPQTLGSWSSANYTKLVNLVSSTNISGGVANISGTSSGFTGSLAGDVAGTQTSTKVTSIQGYPVGNAAPSNGQALLWVAAQNRWEPGALPGQLPPTGAAGGALQGTYPNPTLKAAGVTFDKLAAGSAAGQVLQYNGTTWSAAKLNYSTLVNAHGSSPWPTAGCLAGEALSWASVSDSFVCQTVSAALSDGSVGTAKIADGAVSDQKISGVLVSKIQSAAGKYFTYAPNNQTCSAGEVLKWSSGRWECGTDNGGSGTVTSVTSANTDIGVANTTTAPVLTLNSGTGANQILKLDASSRIPAVNGSLLTSLNASNLATGTVAPARLGSGTPSASNFLRGDGSWAAASGSGVTTLNGLSAATQTLAAPGTAGTAPNWASATSTHTLNIPMASATGVTAGLISKTQYDAFNGKQAAGNYITALTGDVTATGPGSATATIANNSITATKIANGAVTDVKIQGVNVSKIGSATGKYFTYAPNGSNCSNGEFLKKTANGWECGVVSGGNGTVTSVAAGSGLTGGPITTTGTLAVDTGTTAGKILQLDGSARIPAVNGSLLKALNASELTTGTIPAARMPALTGEVTASAGSTSLALTTTGVSAGTYRSVTVDAKGRVTAGTNPTTLSAYGITNGVVNAGGVLSLQSGADSSKPAAGTAGRLYFALDAKKIYRDSGSAWVVIAESGSLPTGTSIGHMLRWNGSEWASSGDATSLTLNATNMTAGTLPSGRLPNFIGDVTSVVGTNSLKVTSLQGRAVANTAPANGQVLKWNGSNWAPAADIASSTTLSCPGMTLVDADPSNGKGAFCISSEKTASSYTTMTDTCYGEDSELCSAADVRRFCKVNGGTFSAAWTSTFSGVSASPPALKVYKISCSTGNPSGAYSYLTSDITASVSYRCCRR